MAIPKCPNCDERNTEKHSLIYKLILNDSVTRDNTGPAYWEYKCKDCGETFEVRFDYARVIGSAIRIGKEIEVLPIQTTTNTEGFYPDEN